MPDHRFAQPGKQIGTEVHHASRGAGALAADQVGTECPERRLRAVDEEAAQEQHGHALVHRAGRDRVHIERGDRGQRHVEHDCGVAARVEQFVGDPAIGRRSERHADGKCNADPARIDYPGRTRLGPVGAEKVHRHPHQKAIAGRVLKTDRKSGNHQSPVRQHRLVAGKRGFAIGGIRGRFFVRDVVLRRRKSHILRLFARDQIERDAADQQQHDRNSEDPTPVELEIADHDQRGHERQHRGHSGREGVEPIDRAALVPSPPVREQPAARRPAHGLEVTVDAPAHR